MYLWRVAGSFGHKTERKLRIFAFSKKCWWAVPDRVSKNLYKEHARLSIVVCVTMRPGYFSPSRHDRYWSDWWAWIVLQGSIYSYVFMGVYIYIFLQCIQSFRIFRPLAIVEVGGWTQLLGMSAWNGLNWHWHKKIYRYQTNKWLRHTQTTMFAFPFLAHQCVPISFSHSCQPWEAMRS